ncbi:bifunctional proline dehydrogenase/L-glutamate gamma-semialdehyde dehydrogenase PutA [Pikeienuella piscinae]|uniref:Bifunctional protein PutA n=1 Tax=Pikeienuella piscinae TaxID=2748098 RepID=A0A7L5BVA8_9RHOB|nr:bifunctional proline dehydrogenase/L-glutamate gamma-semialdehyde dehydrogenase PutA [Pikeienuella piscinae]QIE54417.1 bifunctional proline dehydrogenase/L-glutamate gamma-semialdehyde dehydrogenase PutA [Pikeienuella piscinae]
MDQIRHALRAAEKADEADCLAALTRVAALSPQDRAAAAVCAADLVRAVRGAGAPGLMESFLAEYGLSTVEGVALMCLAEALLRVPDSETIDDLIQDKIAPHDWGAHVGDSGSILVNASTWGLMLTGRVLDDEDTGVAGALRGMVRRLGEPVIRRAVGAAMREMGSAFVLGETIRAAMKRGDAMVAKGYTYSYDMLGEAARTMADADRYMAAYEAAIAAIAGRAKSDDIGANPGISVKLSALHPRYERKMKAVTAEEVSARLLKLAQQAKAARIGLNVDAEEVDRLDLSLDVIEAALSDPSLAGWDGFGVVVQAYQRRAPLVIDWLHALAEKKDRKIMVRLVKGAYWDTEIKRAQVMGLGNYPVFTRKAATDVSYLGCARKLLGMRDRIYPQFATHNAHSASAILIMAGGADESFEFQRLHGMGEALHEAIRKESGARCRIYAPVGAHEDLLAYLVRRLLENGANSSFVNQIVDEDVPAETVAADPFETLEAAPAPNPLIPAPADLFAPERRNAKGWDIAGETDLTEIDAARAPFLDHLWGEEGEVRLNPATGAPVGRVIWSDPDAVAGAVAAACAAAPDWAARPAAARAAVLERAADLYEAHFGEIFVLLAREAGKTLDDAVAELREAVDFLRYYAAGAPGAPGAARGVVACISPWNFPLAIFTGQIAAALAAGNAVVAKPAEQTPLIAALAIRLLHEAGVPIDALRLVQGAGDIGAALTAARGLGGVCFTGSTEVARLIERQLAKTAPEAMLIAETGGLNAMIVDSTALPEQAVRDIVASAFQSAGQRCSALRVLYVQEDVAPKLTEMLFGAMDALRIGDPLRLETDIGPVIDEEARETIENHVEAAQNEGRLLHRIAAPGAGVFSAPAAIRVSGIEAIEREVFGPVLHVATFPADRVDAVVRAVNAKGYGLTFGLHTRIDRRVQQVVDTAAVGNLYVNRNQIGAIVGSQPFGGEGLSGTGPKAGGPHYLARFRSRPAPRAAAAPAVAARPPLDGAAARALLGRLSPGDWAGRRDRIDILRELLRGRASAAMNAAAALDCGPLDLPGPTGESNRLRLAPLGRVICLGAGEALLGHAVQALRIGNAVLAIGPEATRAMVPLLDPRLPLLALDGDPPEGFLAAAHFEALALSEPSRAGALRLTLAGREGPLIRLIAEEIAPERFAAERSLSIDTTAAGGNAQLLAAVG